MSLLFIRLSPLLFAVGVGDVSEAQREKLYDDKRACWMIQPTSIILYVPVYLFALLPGRLIRSNTPHLVAFWGGILSSQIKSQTAGYGRSYQVLVVSAAVVMVYGTKRTTSCCSHLLAHRYNAVGGHQYNTAVVLLAVDAWYPVMHQVGCWGCSHMNSSLQCSPWSQDRLE